MIKAKMKNGQYLFVIDDENIKRLKGGEDMLVKCKEIGLDAEILISYTPDVMSFGREKSK